MTRTARRRFLRSVWPTGCKDLGVTGGDAQLQYVRAHLVVAARAAELEPPIDSVYPYLQDTDGLRRQACLSRSLGFFGKSAIHPAQLPVIHAEFSPRDDELQWAREFVDLPVAERARNILRLAETLS